MVKFFDNLEELFTGLGIGFIYLAPILSPTLALTLALVTAILWRMGGNGYKWARRYVIPGLMALITILLFKNPIFAVFLLWVPIFSIGYGIPDATDNGSALGRFVYNLVGKKEDLATFVTRFLIGLAMWLVTVPACNVNPAYVLVSGFMFSLYYPIVTVLSKQFTRLP